APAELEDRVRPAPEEEPARGVGRVARDDLAVELDLAALLGQVDVLVRDLEVERQRLDRPRLPGRRGERQEEVEHAGGVEEVALPVAVAVDVERDLALA